jgi:putative tricarboxylic transport membrane protein
MVNVKDAAAALVLIALAGGMWYGSYGFAPDARVFPHIVAALMVGLALIMLVRSFAGAAGGAGMPFFKHFPTFAVGFAMIVGYIFLVSRIGYFSATVVFVPAFALMLGLRRPWIITLSTIGFVLLVYLVFVTAFERPLPLELFDRR